MQKMNKVKAKNRLFVKVYFNYAVMLTVFAVLIGIIFMKLYETNTMNDYKDKLEKQAKSISRRLQQAIINDEEESYLEYLVILGELDDEEPDVWTISNPNAVKPMDKSLENVVMDNIDLPEDAREVIGGVFLQNQPMSRNGYYEQFGGVSVIVGEPIRVNGEVVGAVMLVSQIEGQNRIIKDSMSLIILSILVALFISFIIAIVFAKGLSNPISKMRITALELANGKYQSKTDINRQDEIGDLARSIDILADELAENEIERQNRDQMRIDFFANVSHELRTPITVIRAYTETLVDGVVTDPEKVAQYYDRMLKECKGMERLVGDLLLLSKMQNPDFIIEKEPVNVVQIFDNLIRSISAISSEKNITVEMNRDRTYYMMMGDYDRLRQMFLIILDNAIKFTPENSSIHINLSIQDKLRVSIRDEGIGIPEDDLKSIFNKFYKSKLKQNEKGSGLGLAIARQIAIKHDGVIEVYSEVGVGTEFVFYFQCLEDYVGELDI
ncbi:MAG: ATP-binding protein [Anaerocolumna aminovalerica]|jgi:signal transduction histidine kinase|uniref:sensor histidine kinase n=2 Tax=Anaerocolumna aminovalerica TaxID=1527 RepID=UPI00248C4738|nr:ATP-binding protein [Anaerocolumna aminovalerica]MDU6263459.1 ATP-binding protein [Anaerocolumna aminovalerica]